MGEALIKLEFFERAKEISQAARNRDCYCKNARPHRRIIHCEMCLTILIGHAMTEAATTPEERAAARAKFNEPKKEPD